MGSSYALRHTDFHVRRAIGILFEPLDPWREIVLCDSLKDAPVADRHLASHTLRARLRPPTVRLGSVPAKAACTERHLHASILTMRDIARLLLACLVVATVLPLGGCYAQVDSGPGVVYRPAPPPPGYGRHYEWRTYDRH